MKLNYYGTALVLRKFTHDTDTGKFWCVIIIMFLVVSFDGLTVLFIGFCVNRLKTLQKYFAQFFFQG